MTISKSFEFKNTGEIIAPSENIHGQDLYGMIGLARGFSIITGCEITRSTNQISIAAGTLYIAGNVVIFTGDNITVDDAGMSALQHRWTNVYITPGGVIGKTDGSEVLTTEYPVKTTDTINIVMCSILKEHGVDVVEESVRSSVVDISNSLIAFKNRSQTWSALQSFNANLEISNTEPKIDLMETDGSVDQNWRMFVQGGILKLSKLNDAKDLETLYFAMTAAGIASYISKLNANGGLGVTGNIDVSGLVDGVDISVHAGNVSAHHTRYTDAEANQEALIVFDTQIEIHSAEVDAHHAKYTDTEAKTALEPTLGIDSANKFYTMGVITKRDNGTIGVTGEITNVSSTDPDWVWGFSIDLIKPTGEVFVATAVKVQVSDADSLNKVNSCRVYGVTSAGAVTIENTTVGWTTVGSKTMDISPDTTIGGVYNSIFVRLQCVTGTASALEIRAVELEGYYS